MIRLQGKDLTRAMVFMEMARQAAFNSTCLRSRCGSVVVSKTHVIGRGFNSPPFEDESQRRCAFRKDVCHIKVTDKTCCVHAEQRAILDAMHNKAGLLEGATLYFARIDTDGGLEFSGQPYCTICSKLALDTGVESFVLWHEEGIFSYKTGEYNKRSYDYADFKDL